MHSQNKNEFVNVLCKDQLEGRMRDNVILLGDLMTDVDMVTPSNHNEVIRIAFLNDLEKNGQFLQNYLELYDLVIAGDGPLTPVNDILYQILR